MSDVLPATVVACLGVLWVLVVSSRFERDERAVLWLSLGAHLAAAVALGKLYQDYYGYGDILTYFRIGQQLSDGLGQDFGYYAPEVLELVTGGTPELPFQVPGAGGPTGTMTGLAAVVSFLSFDSFYATSFVFALLALAGQVALYRVIRGRVAAPLRRTALVCVFLVPSTLLWTSGILKESIAFLGLGWVCLGVHQVFQGGRLARGVVRLALGAWFIGLTKPYILLPLFLALIVSLYWSRMATSRGHATPRLRPLYLGLAVLAMLALVTAVGELFPRYALDNLLAETGRLQESAAQSGLGGSTLEVEGSGARTLGGQLAQVPVALVTALFRPTIFEAHNLIAMANALETSAIAVAVLCVLVRRRPLPALRQILGSPLLIFCAVFVLSFAVAVGLATLNLGTLSRYRAPMMPFYVFLLAALLRGDLPVEHSQRATSLSDEPCVG